MLEPQGVTQGHMLLSGLWGDHGGDLLCFHCGAHETGNLPADLDVFAAALRRFTKAHENCQPTPAGAALKRRHDEAWEKVKAELAAAGIKPTAEGLRTIWKGDTSDEVR